MLIMRISAQAWRQEFHGAPGSVVDTALDCHHFNKGTLVHGQPKGVYSISSPIIAGYQPWVEALFQRINQPTVMRLTCFMVRLFAKNFQDIILHLRNN